jgi:hypothetical protein
MLPFAVNYLHNDWVFVGSRLVLLLAVLGFSAFNNLMHSALQTTMEMNAAIIQAALPASIFVLNFCFLSA